ncbi:MAG: arginine--tRNA ligase [Sedimentisphaerales bacterium]|nr:arginine--tRNA ligase [Sedimentisphaerales bacterium]
MKPIVDILEERVVSVIAEVTGEVAPGVVKPTQDAKFGDYQANGIMGLAKKLKQNSRQLAQQIVDKLDVSDMCAEPEIAGPGFINFRLKPEWLGFRLTEAIKDKERLGIDPLDNPPTTVIDFSGPNIAKQMHVGHLRSTVIGDVIARILEFWYGDAKKIIRQNHIGDWGLQMGMVIFSMHTKKWREENNITLDNLEHVYRHANELAKNNPGIAENFKQSTVNLQSGDEKETGYWKKACEVSLNACMEIYQQLGVKLTLEDVRGESFYADKLPSVISDLSVAKMLSESDGAQCVFMDGFKTKDGEPLPLIVQKSDGAYLYATTDLAAIRFRVNELRADRIIYVTDARQKLHFEMVFSCVRKAGWAGENVTLEHVPFGSVLGNDGRPFKTRSGENIKLRDLLDEAHQRARKIVEEKNPDLPADQKESIAQAVGIGAVKYADLSNNLVSDYIFDWDRMLAFDGNTAPYVQYSYARVDGIFKKGNIDLDNLIQGDFHIELNDPKELSLAKLLLRYGEVVETVARDLRPHLLTNYLFDLAQAYSGFFETCPVLKSPEPVKTYRLLLCYQTARVVEHGLGLLGIQAIEQM